MDILIKHANLNGRKQDLLIENGKIVSLGESIVAHNHRVIHADGRLTISGLVDAHMHLDKCLLCEQKPYLDLSGPEKGARTREVKATLSQEQIMHNSRRVIDACIRAGSLALRTNVDVDPVIGLNGVKALLALKQELRHRVILQIVAFAQEGFEKYPETAGLLRQALELGCDAVGGHTLVDQDGKAHIDTIFEIAKAYQVPCEFHTDESGKPEHFLLPYLAEKTMQEGFEGRVNAIHACSLAAVNAQTAADTIRQVKDAGIRIIVAPTAIATRQLTLVKELLAAGVPVCLGSDNIGDFFNPLGSGNLLHVAHLLIYVKRFFSDEELGRIFTMITSAGAEILGIQDRYEFQEGHPANISIFDAHDLRETLIKMPRLQCVIRNGAIIYESDAAHMTRV